MNHVLQTRKKFKVLFPYLNPPLVSWHGKVVSQYIIVVGRVSSPSSWSGQNLELGSCPSRRGHLAGCTIDSPSNDFDTENRIVYRWNYWLAIWLINWVRRKRYPRWQHNKRTHKEQRRIRVSLSNPFRARRSLDRWSSKIEKRGRREEERRHPRLQSPRLSFHDHFDTAKKKLYAKSLIELTEDKEEKISTLVICATEGTK